MEDIQSRLVELLKNKNRPIVFICGLGGSGKTTFTKGLAVELKAESVAVHSDWWAKHSTAERKQRIADALQSGDLDRIEQEENPQNWYDVWEIIGKDLKTLQSTGELVLHNAWNQETGKKDLEIQLSVPEEGVILFDGIYLLHSEIADVADLIIYIDADPEDCRKRTELRDAHRSDPEYLAYKAELMRKYDIPYFEKYRRRADIVIKPE